jgi:hypothetical protein
MNSRNSIDLDNLQFDYQELAEQEQEASSGGFSMPLLASLFGLPLIGGLFRSQQHTSGCMYHPRTVSYSRRRRSPGSVLIKMARSIFGGLFG